jgi:hypothetical protein
VRLRYGLLTCLSGTLYYSDISVQRQIFAPHLDVDELPAQIYLQSIHNIVIERGWLRLRLEWGDNVKLFWKNGEGIYNQLDPDH